MIERKPQFRNDGIRHATINGHRFHLRLTDPTEENFLWINGRQPPLVLDQTAAEFFGYVIEAMWLFQSGEGNKSQEVIDYVVTKMHGQYGRGRRGIPKSRLLSDLNRIFSTIMEVANGGCPVEYGLPFREMDPRSWIAPARMDLAVTSACNLRCSKCYAGDAGRIPEMPMAEWLKVYQILWKLGVPQVVFTGGEPTLRGDIVELITEADEFVTGLITNGTKLEFLAPALRSASLDYVQVTVESRHYEIHDKLTCSPGSHEQTVRGIRAALEAGLQVVTNTTLMETNASHFLETMAWLKELGVTNMACNSLICSGRGQSCKDRHGLSDETLAGILKAGQTHAQELGVSLNWYSPTCYNQGINPINLGFGIKACSAAAHNMTIQPDGSVLPCQSWPQPVGNILSDDWEQIWNHTTCFKLREQLYYPTECSLCEHLDTCAGGCPLDHGQRTPSEGSQA